MTKKLIDIRAHLIELARNDYKNTTYYHNIINEFELKYDMSNEKDYIKFSKDLAKIFKYEIDNNRPCLTILIVSTKIQNGFDIQIPSKGFYYYAEKFNKIGNVEGRIEFFNREKENLITFWKIDENYRNYKDFK